MREAVLAVGTMEFNVSRMTLGILRVDKCDCPL